jgi:general secretion pathway protein J
VNSRPAVSATGGLRARAGFTLVEVLIAVGISALIGVMAYSGLSLAIAASEATRDQQQALLALEETWQLLQRDLDQVVLSPARDAQGRPEPAFSGGDDSEYLLRLTRMDWADPHDRPRADLQRVGYRLSGGSLWRDQWQGSEARAGAVLLEGVTAIRMRFLDPVAAAATEQAPGWQPRWQATGPGERLPAAVEVVMTVEVWGELRRLFPLPAGV